MLWIVEDSIDRSRFHHTPEVHDHYRVRHLADDAQIVRDEDMREAAYNPALNACEKWPKTQCRGRAFAGV